MKLFLLLPALLLVSACRAAEAPLRAVTLGGNIAIGDYALLGATQCSDSVAIGLAELMGAEHEHGTTSINSRQLYLSRGFDAFCLNPAQADRIQKTPLWYLGGDLHLNARSVRTRHGDLVPLARAFADDLRGYDLYLSEDGSDANDGRSPITPKQTIWGCYLAATNDGERVAVLPGTYVVPEVHYRRAPESTSGYSRWFIHPDHSLSFTAVAGNRHTFITGEGFRSTDTNETFRSGLAFYHDNQQEFTGFTFENLAAMVQLDATNVANQHHCAPMIAGVTLRDCVVRDSSTAISSGWGLFVSDEFIGCTITNVSVTAYIDGYSPRCFYYCNLDNTSVFLDNITYDESFYSNPSAQYKRTAFFSYSYATNSLIHADSLNAVYEKNGPNGGIRFWRCKDSTFVVNVTNADGVGLNAARSEGCYYAVGDGMVYEPALTNGLNNAFAPAWTNTLLDADYVPASLDCPAVHDDGSPDSGWKQSGLGWQKTARKLAERLSALEPAK